MKNVKFSTAALLFLLCNVLPSFCHCDTMDGPVVADAKKAIEQSNVNYVLKWVSADREEEIKIAFDLIMRIRSLNADAKYLADMYFFETIVRIHRYGEGIGYTGIKPSGEPIDPNIKAADESITLGRLTPLEKLTPPDKLPELETQFAHVMELKNFDVNDVSAGREFVNAYVQFFHFAEGGHEASHDHHEESNHLTHVSWVLAVFFFATTLIFGMLYFKKAK